MEKVDSLKQIIRILHDKQGVIESYFHHLARNPERMDSLFIWAIVVAVWWTFMIVNRKVIMDGLRGSNLLLQSWEIVVFMYLWIAPPIICYAAFIKDVPFYVWICIGVGLGFCLFGRGILDYGLAYLGKAPIQIPKPDVTTTTTTTETKIN
jgi:hypothetical protein